MCSIRMPITTAARKGISAVTATAIDSRVMLTRHGRVVAVVDSAERLDRDLRQVREASAAVLDFYAARVSERSEKFDLDQVCARLGVDADQIRERAGQRVAHLA